MDGASPRHLHPPSVMEFTVLKRLRVLGVSAVLATVSTMASAATLDFTALKTFGAASTATTAVGKFHGVSWSLTSIPAGNFLSYNFGDTAPDPFKLADDGYDGKTVPNGLLAFEGDGIGSYRYARSPDDEVQVERGEELLLTFDRALTFSGFHALDLFKQNADDQDPESMLVYDAISGSLIAQLFGADIKYQNTIGGYAFGTGTVTTTALRFVPGAGQDDLTGDFALAALDVAPIPVPAAGLLLLTALGGVGALRARRKAA